MKIGSRAAFHPIQLRPRLKRVFAKRAVSLEAGSAVIAALKITFYPTHSGKSFWRIRELTMRKLKRMGKVACIRFGLAIRTLRVSPNFGAQ
ncbi:MAG TPA: hypothetical protein VHK70_05445 [Burkholderiaceae bacterium]|jgi:transcriptional regulator NrdR family protein|nr:hypothetical protein [Burkholderiaceae bacterium]